MTRRLARAARCALIAWAAAEITLTLLRAAADAHRGEDTTREDDQ